MATYYWVGGAGTWNGTNTANWSTGSGGATGAGPPTNADDVIFDNNSDSGANFTVTGSTTADCKNFTIGSGASLPDRIISFSGRINIYGNFTAQNSANNVFTSCTPNFLSTSAGNTVTMAGRTFGSVTVNGAGGEWTQQDAIAWGSASIFTLTAGTWKTGNFNMTGGILRTTGTSTKAIEFGSSTISLQNDGLDFSASTGLTVTAGTSQITLTSNRSDFFGGGQTYYNVSMTGASPGFAPKVISGVNTFNNLTLTAPSSTGLNLYEFQDNQTIGGTLTASGASAIRRLQIRGASGGTWGSAITLTCAVVAAISDTDFQYITLAGAASPISGTRLGNALGNTNITFDAGVNKYWNLAGTQNSTATGWALLSGGAPAANNFPLAQDTIVFDNAGAMGTVNFNDDFWFGALNAVDRTSAGTIQSTNTDPRFTGNMTIGSGITWSGTGSGAVFQAANGQTLVLDTNGKSLGISFSIQTTGTGKVQLAEDATFTRLGTSFFFQGILDLNSYTLSIPAGFSSTYTTTREIQFGSTGKLLFAVNDTGAVQVINFDFTNFTLTGSKQVEVSPVSAPSSISFNISNQTAGSVNQAFNLLLSSSSISVTATSSSYWDDISTQGYTNTTTNFFNNKFVYGNITIGTGHSPSATTSGCTIVTPTGVTKSITSNSRTLNTPLIINNDGTFELADALTLGAAGVTSKALTFTKGNFDSKNFNIACSGVTSSTSSAKSITFGTSTITITVAGTNWDLATGTNITLSAASSKIVFNITGGSAAQEFRTGGLSYGEVEFSGTNTGGTPYDFTFVGSTATFSKWTNTRTVNTDIDFNTNGCTYTFTTAFNMSGTAGQLTELRRSIGSGSFNLVYSGSGVISVDYMLIARSNASPALTWYAGNNSTNGGNNTGWIFTAPPPPANGGFFQLFFP